MSWEYAAQCIRNALVLAGDDRDYAYLLPWLHAASAFINLNLGRYNLAAANQLAGLPQVSPYHKLVAMLYKAEALLMLDRAFDGVKCLAQAVPLQSMPCTSSTLLYNRALLHALTSNLQRAAAAFAMVCFLLFWRLTCTSCASNNRGEGFYSSSPAAETVLC
ncbi:unnamed protein product [Gongylonema pulchrum]|uniref:CCR4-NOT transcription complex subunit 10 n=1 Tax=Gongylonema pulchrum TaxID=637853 RepID=A0A183DWQ0_9BILA|nr:unnamed protein product [Gongylonema pulchrum]